MLFEAELDALTRDEMIRLIAARRGVALKRVIVGSEHASI
jgi:hypothetical protein